jgi:hypothetical protein
VCVDLTGGAVVNPASPCLLANAARLLFKTAYPLAVWATKSCLTTLLLQGTPTANLTP